MKKFFLVILTLVLSVTMASAQSTMTDEQIISYVMSEQAKGTSQQQIVTQLMKRGVTVSQITRLKEKYERQQGAGGLGISDITGAKKVEDRLRQQNGKNPRQVQRDGYVSAHRKKATQAQGYKNTYDEEDSEFLKMQRELNAFMPDSLTMMEQLYVEEEDPTQRVFGRDIFNNEMLSFEPNMNIATPPDYVLGPGDAVFIDIYGASQRTIEGTISPDGAMTIEDFGPVTLSGMTVEKANRKLKQTLGERYSSSDIKLTVGQTRTIIVSVMGEARVPGTYTLSAFSTVFHALYSAGGISDIGTLRSIKVYRNSKLVADVDIYDYILNGQQKGNIRLTDGDVVVVGPYQSIVNLTGKVKRPMFYEMKGDESLGTLIRYSGGFAGDAYTKSVKVVRKAGTQYSIYDISEFDLSSFRLADADSVNVDSVIPRYSNMVEVKGAVFRPGKYQVGGSITSVRTLIEHAEGLTEDAFTARAVMHRMKADRSLEVLAVDIDGIMAGKVADVPLRNEDVLYVPGKKELMEEQTLTIHGEVRYPGTYVYASNETIEDFILQAGGLTNTASVMKVDISRRMMNPKATSPTDTIAQTFTLAIKDGFVIDGKPGFTLEPFDEVYVRSSPGYTTQKNVTVEGEVLFAGSYTLATKSQRLSELIKQAGGVTNTAYIEGARLERKITPEERLRMQDVLDMAKAQSGEKDSINTKKLELGNTYYVGIQLDKALEEPGSNYDIVLREGDRIIVPEYSGTVKISGDVMYPNTVAYKKGKSVDWYVDQAGGWGNRAKKSRTYIIYMNGTVARAGYKNKPMPGCEIIVPSKPKASKMSVAEIVAIGSGTASIATMIATIANLVK